MSFLFFSFFFLAFLSHLSYLSYSFSDQQLLLATAFCSGKMKPASLSASSACHDRTRRRSFIHTIHSLKSDKRTPTKCPISPASVCEGSSSSQIPPVPTSIQHAKSCINLPLSSTPTPLLTLLLSTTSFLNATISEADQVQRLYTIDSKGPRTDIRRDDTVQGATVVGTIRWRPENDDERIPFGLKSNVTIGMAHGRKRFVEDFLKSNPLRKCVYSPSPVLTFLHRLFTIANENLIFLTFPTVLFGDVPQTLILFVVFFRHLYQLFF